jgi:hypothetical protein
MASAVYPYETERGTVYPRLDLTVEFREPKHIRLRSYDESGRAVDTLGCHT